jgi:hypothetical protein
MIYIGHALSAPDTLEYRSAQGSLDYPLPQKACPALLLEREAGRSERMVKIIERVAEHYDTQEMEFGRTYIWCPESVVLECKCGKRMTLTRSELIKNKPACECGTDNTASVREEVILKKLVDEDYEAHHHPWRYWHTTRDTGIPF